MNDDQKRYTIDHLNADPRNPRIIDAPDAENLTMSIRTYGDLSGIVWNRRNGKLVAGHQRTNDFKKTPNPRIEYTQRYDTPNSVGTTARGFIWLEGYDEPFGYREVDWDEDFAIRANLAANRIQGRFDSKKLKTIIADIDPDLRDQTGFLEDEIDALLAEEPETDDDAERPPSQGDRLDVFVDTDQREIIDAAIYNKKANDNRPLTSGAALAEICQAYMSLERNNRGSI